MRTRSEVQDDIWSTEHDIEDARERLWELEDECIEIEDREAQERECLSCDGTGKIECPDDVDPQEWDYGCQDCEGSGETT